MVFMEFLQLRGQDLNLFVAPLLPPSEGRLSSAAQDDAQASGQEGADLVPFPLGPVWMMDVARNAELARELLGARASRGRIAGGTWLIPTALGVPWGRESSSGRVISAPLPACRPCSSPGHRASCPL